MSPIGKMLLLTVPYLGVSAIAGFVENTKISVGLYVSATVIYVVLIVGWVMRFDDDGLSEWEDDPHEFPLA